MHGAPSEVTVRNRIRETSVRVFLMLGDITDNLAIECSVREIHPRNERVMRGASKRRISQSPLVAINELRSICEMRVQEREPFLPFGTVFVDFGRIDVDLGFGEGEWGGVFAETVVVHCGDSQ